MQRAIYINNKFSNVCFVRFPREEAGNNHPVEATWPLSIGVMATILKKKECNVKIFDLFVENYKPGEIIEYIVKNKIVTALLQFETPSLSQAIDFSRTLKGLNKNITVVGFGQGACVLPEYIIKEGKADICITTDPEFILADLINANFDEQDLEKVAHIVFKKKSGEIVFSSKKEKTNFNVDNLPFIDLSLFNLRLYKRRKYPKPFFWGSKWGFLRTSWGCPYRCIFCSPLLRHSINKVYKAHSIEYIVNQINYYKYGFGIKVFSIEDDIFSLKISQVERFCHSVAPLDIKWTVDTRADRLTFSLLKKMKEAGCFGVGLGIESGSEKILKLLRKGETRTQIKEAALNVKRLGLLLVGYVIIGAPGETKEDLKSTVKFIDEVKPQVLHLHYFTPYPGSDFYNSHKNGFPETATFSHYRYSFNFSNVDTDKLKDFMKYFYRHYYLSFSYLKEYLTKRAVYSIFDFDELSLIGKSFKFIFSSRS